MPYMAHTTIFMQVFPNEVHFDGPLPSNATARAVSYVQTNWVLAGSIKIDSGPAIYPIKQVRDDLDEAEHDFRWTTMSYARDTEFWAETAQHAIILRMFMSEVQ